MNFLEITQERSMCPRQSSFHELPTLAYLVYFEFWCFKLRQLFSAYLT